MALARGGDHAAATNGCVDSADSHIICRVVTDTFATFHTMNDQFSIEPTPSDDQAAAVVAAIMAYLAVEEPTQPEEATPSGWQCAAKLGVQGLRPMRAGHTPRWGTIERLRRASGFYGVTGL